MFPMSLFCVWVRKLLLSKKEVRVRIGRSIERSAMHKILVGGGILNYLENIGAKIDRKEFSRRRAHDLIPLHNLSKSWFEDHNTSQENLWQSNQEFLTVFRSSAPKLAREIFAVLVKELAENAYLHGAADYPYIGLYQAESSRGNMSNHTITPYPPGTKYIEIVIGDGGPGIPAILKVKPNWESEFLSINSTGTGTKSPSRLTPDERAIHYAFEFASTSNVDARRIRIDELISGNKEIDPHLIGTGLYHVISLAREHRADFFVLSGRAFGHFDCSSGQVKYRSFCNSQKAKAVLFPGTHYLFRFPLVTTGQATQNNVITTGSLNVMRFVATTVFQRKNSSQSEAIVIDDSMTSLAKGLAECERDASGNTALCVYSNAAPLSTRAVEVYFRLVCSHLSRFSNVFWLSDASQLFSAIKGILTYPQRQSQQELNPFPIWMGKTHGQHFRRLSNKAGQIMEEQVHLDGACHSLLVDQIKNRLRGLIADRIKKEDVSLFPGPFVFPGGYYTDRFYQLSKALDEDAFRNNLADWLLFNTVRPPELIVAQCSAMEHAANTIARRCIEMGWTTPNILPLKGDETFTRIHAAAFFEAQKLNTISTASEVWILTDVVLKAERIKRCAQAVQKALSPNASLKIATIVDARLVHQPSLALPDVNLPLMSVHEDPITVNQDLTHLPTHGNVRSGVEKFWWVDIETHRPVERERRRGAKHDIDLLLSDNGTTFLRTGHIEDGDQHFGYWIDFPRFVQIYQNEIINWLDDLLKFVPEKNLATDCLILGSKKLRAFRGALQDSLPNFRSIQSIDSFDLDTGFLKLQPKASRSKKSRLLLVLPAMSSGTTLMQLLDQSLKLNVSEIVVAVLCSRLDDEKFEFFSRIHSYAGKHVEIHAFTRFVIPSFKISPSACPICSLSRIYQNVFDAINKTNHPRIADLLERKIKSLSQKPSSLLGDKEAEERIYEAQLRHLLAIGKNDYSQKLKLIERLKQNEYLPAFCKIALTENIESKLDFEDVKRIAPAINERLSNLLDQAVENRIEINLDDMATFVAYLLPRSSEKTKPRIINLLQHSTYQNTIAEELVLNLMRGDRYFVSPKLLMYLADRTNIQVRHLLHDASDYLKEVLKPATPLAISRIIRILEQIEKSSDLREAIRQSRRAIISVHKKQKSVSIYHGEIDAALYSLKETYKTTFMHEIERLKDTKLWEKINTPMLAPEVRGLLPEQALDTVEEIVSTLLDRSRNEFLELEMPNQIEKILTILTRFADHVRTLFPNPIRVLKRLLNADSIEQQCGGRIKVEILINENELRPVLFPEAELDKVISEILKNIAEAVKEERQAKLRVQVSFDKEENCLRLMFSDNLPGRIAMRQAGGGLLLVYETCESFGATVDITNELNESSFTKMITISMFVEERIFNESQK